MGKAGKMLVQALECGSLSIEDNVQFLSNMGAFDHPSTGEMTMHSVSLNQCMSRKNDAAFYNTSFQFLDSLQKIGHLNMDVMSALTSIQNLNFMLVEDDAPLADSISSLCEKSNLKESELEQGGKLNKDPQVRKLLSHALHVEDDGSSLMDMMESLSYDSVMGDDSNPLKPKIIKAVNAEKAEKKKHGKSMSKAQEVKFARTTYRTMIQNTVRPALSALSCLNAAAETGNQELLAMYEIHSTLTLLAGVSEDELCDIEIGLGSYNQVVPLVSALPSIGNAKNLKEYRSPIEKSIKDLKKEKETRRSVLKEKYSNSALVDRQEFKEEKRKIDRDIARRMKDLKRTFVLMSYKWIKESD